MSGSVSYLKRKLNEIIEKCSFGDYIVVQELSRLSRSSRDILNIRHLLSQKHITFHAVKENITWSATNTNDTSDSNVKTLLYGMIGELEREKISQRVKTGIYNARKDNPEFHQLLERRERTLEFHFQGKKRVEIAEHLNCSKNNIAGDLKFQRQRGVIGKESRVIAIDIEGVKNAFRDGKSWKEVAEMFKVSKSTIHRRLKNVGGIQ